MDDELYNLVLSQLVSILSLHGTLSKKKLHQHFEVANNNKHWTQHIQQQLGSLKSFLLENQEFSVCGGSNFRVQLAGDGVRDEVQSDFGDVKAEESDDSDENESDELARCKEELRQLREQLRFLDGTAHTDKWNRLSLQTLNELEENTRSAWARIQATRSRVLERKFNCIVCLVNSKNILINGCNHIVLCEDCERRLKSKTCPLCQKKYRSVKKIQI